MIYVLLQPANHDVVAEKEVELVRALASPDFEKRRQLEVTVGTHKVVFVSPEQPGLEDAALKKEIERPRR